MRSVIKPIGSCKTKKSDHNNGYFIQDETWGSCFIRASKSPRNRNEVWVKHNNQPKCFHTYTRFPARLLDSVYHVYVNYPKSKSVTLHLPPGARIIGFDTPQPSGDFLNRTFLILSPGGEPGLSLEEKEGLDEINFVVDQYEKKKVVNTESFFRGRKVQHMYLDAAGFETSKEFAGLDKFDFVPAPDEVVHYEGEAVNTINVKID